MNIHEYQAKNIIKKYGIKIPDSVLITDKEDINSAVDGFDATAYVVKAQIHAGSRAKDGGVKIAYTKDIAKKIAHEMFGMRLVTTQTDDLGQKVNIIYIESAIDIQKEYYLSIVFDRNISRIVIIASSAGGANIEQISRNNPNKIIKTIIDPAIGLQDFNCRNITLMLALRGEVAKQMEKIIKSLYHIFVLYDATLIEINPIVLSRSNQLIALDAKMSFDDNALFRHRNILNLRDVDEEDELEAIASDIGISYIKMDGNIGCMVNGAGLAMATLDIIHLHGGSPANFLDVGGDAGQKKVEDALSILLSNKSVTILLINIFGGITRCDVVANSIISASKKMEIKIPMVIRLAGTNAEIAKDILNNSGLSIISAVDLADAASKVVLAQHDI